MSPIYAGVGLDGRQRTELSDVKDEGAAIRQSLDMEGSTRTVGVWDPLVRIGHWTLVAAFATAYLTADDFLEVHEWAGYVVAGYVVVRVIWGFVGTEHARFADFLYGPRQAVAYLFHMLRHQAKRYLGHSPAGGIMVFVLLAMLAGTCVTGMAELAASYGDGPLAGLIQKQSGSVYLQTSDHGNSARPVEEEPESALREMHELFANATLFLIILHIAGVVVASIVHRENLASSMISGRKRI